MAMETTHCCGADIYHGISTGPSEPAHHLCKIAQGWHDRTMKSIVVGFDRVMYNDGVLHGDDQQTNSSRLAEYIREKGLGQVTLSAWTRNTNTGNPIRTLTWLVDQPAFELWKTTDRDAAQYREWTKQNDVWATSAPVQREAQVAAANLDRAFIQLQARVDRVLAERIPRPRLDPLPIDEAERPVVREARDRNERQLADIAHRNPEDLRLRGLPPERIGELRELGALQERERATASRQGRAYVRRTWRR